MKNADIKEELEKIIHPEIDDNLVDLGMIGEVKIDIHKIEVELVLPFIDVPIKQMLVDLIKEKTKKFGEVEVIFKEMNEEQRAKFMEKAKGGWKL